MTSLFIGVVSHQGSRFSASQGPHGLGAQLAESLGARGVATTLVVRTEDAHDEAVLPLTTEVVRESLREKFRVERSWQGYLHQGGPEGTLARLRRRAALTFWQGQQEATLLEPWRRELVPTSTAVRSVRRLVNIELSHVALLREAVTSGSDWALVLEDDAATSDIDDCSVGLVGLMSDSGTAPAYVNISQSHTYAELGIEHLLSDSGARWHGPVHRRILRSSRPVTNTVCAILYRTSFAQLLLAEFDALPMTPVVPIDWKLNLALMRMHGGGLLPEGSCWVVDPAPIDQLSMR